MRKLLPLLILIVLLVAACGGSSKHTSSTKSGAPPSRVTAETNGVEIGECAKVASGTFRNRVCSEEPGEGKAGKREYIEIPAERNDYTDGHPEVLLDEPQTIRSTDGEAVLTCKGSLVRGEVTSFTTNTQIIENHRCGLSIKGGVPYKCGNVAPEEIVTGQDTGLYYGITEGVANKLTMTAHFTCEGKESSLLGSYVGVLESKSGTSLYGKPISQYDLYYGPNKGEQSLTLKWGSQSWPVVIEGAQEDVFHSTGKVVIRKESLASSKGSLGGKCKAPATGQAKTLTWRARSKACHVKTKPTVESRLD